MALQITCISKQGGAHLDPHHAIEELGWMDGNERKRCSRIAMYDWLKESKANQAFVKDAQGNVAYLAPREHENGTKFVQTYADKTWTNNLLSLPECPR